MSPTDSKLEIFKYLEDMEVDISKKIPNSVSMQLG